MPDMVFQVIKSSIFIFCITEWLQWTWAFFIRDTKNKLEYLMGISNLEKTIEEPHFEGNLFRAFSYKVLIVVLFGCIPGKNMESMSGMKYLADCPQRWRELT